MHPLLEQLARCYQSFDPELLTRLESLYAPDVEFVDPLHRIEGLENLQHYFAGMMHNLAQCRFEFTQFLCVDGEGASASDNDNEDSGEAVAFWTMHYSHPRLAGGRLLALSGNSHLRFRQKIYYHRDYFDAGAMLYEHLPLLGYAIKKVKQRMK